MPYMYGYICLCIHTPYITWVHVHVNSHYNVSTFNIPLLHNSKSLVLLTMLPHNDQNKQTNQLHGRAFKHRFVKFGVIVRVSKPQLQAQLGNVSIQTIFINDLVNLRNSGEYQKHRMQSQTLGISHLEQEIKCPNRVLGGQGWPLQEWLRELEQHRGQEEAGGREDEGEGSEGFKEVLGFERLWKNGVFIYT